MKYKTHLVGGLLLGAGTLGVVANTINTNPSILSIEGMIFMGGATLGSLFPDIDHRGSYLGRRAKVASFFASMLFEHRGATHAPITAGIMTFLMYLLGGLFIAPPLLKLWFIGFYIGILSHILLDMLTKGGVPILYPISKRKFSLTNMKTGSKGEAAVMSAMIVMGFVVVTKLIF